MLRNVNLVHIYTYNLTSLDLPIRMSSYVREEEEYKKWNRPAWTVVVKFIAASAALSNKPQHHCHPRQFYNALVPISFNTFYFVYSYARDALERRQSKFTAVLVRNPPNSCSYSSLCVLCSFG